MARTQRERREETVARLLDASIDTIIDVGYARASAAVITRRAGLSGGALFRHFDTMGEFMAATAREVMRRQLDAFGKQVAGIPPNEPALHGVLQAMRDITGNDTNVVMYELLIAARTDDRLRGTLQDVLKDYSARILDAARTLPTAEEYPEETLPAVVALLTNAFDGAAIVRAILPQPEVEAGRIPLLATLLTQGRGGTDA